MFDGTLCNTTVAGKPLARLTIGVTNAGGQRAAIEFVRNDETGDLVAELPDPTPDELDADYLLKHGWEKQWLDGLGEVWSDPIGGGDYQFRNALDIQDARECREALELRQVAQCHTPLAERYAGD